MQEPQWDSVTGALVCSRDTSVSSPSGVSTLKREVKEENTLLPNFRNYTQNMECLGVLSTYLGPYSLPKGGEIIVIIGDGGRAARKPLDSLIDSNSAGRTPSGLCVL